MGKLLHHIAQRLKQTDCHFCSVNFVLKNLCVHAILLTAQPIQTFTVSLFQFRGNRLKLQ